MSLEPQKHTKRIKNNQSQTMIFWTYLVLCPKSSAKMIDGSEKWKCQLAFELQNLHVFEKVQQYFIEASRLFPVTCCYKWQGWTWIETWKTWANFFNF